MSRRQSSRGTCVFCKNTYTKPGMYRHLEACKARKAAIAAEDAEDASPVRLFHLAVVGTHASDYWLHLEVPANTSLRDLDQFLRDIWLECCGHLSVFRIGSRNFLSTGLSDWWNADDLDMDFELGEVLAPGSEFSHEYDFGSTTYLSLRVVSEREGTAKKGKPIQIIARNDPPEYLCQECDEPATVICVFCGYTFLCDECIETHVCGEEGLLPVVNSPRMGVCGYTGDAW